MKIIRFHQAENQTNVKGHKIQTQKSVYKEKSDRKQPEANESNQVKEKKNPAIGISKENGKFRSVYIEDTTERNRERERRT